MTKTELTQAVLNGEPVLVVEYRASNAETIKWRDKVSKQALSAPTLRHTVEFSKGSMAVSERVEDTFDTGAYKPPFKKGDKVVLRFTGWQQQKGAVTASGSLELFDSTK